MENLKLTKLLKVLKNLYWTIFPHSVSYITTYIKLIVYQTNAFRHKNGA